MRVFVLKNQLWLPRPVAEVFRFFADARNLELLTPPWLRFEVLTSDPILMHQGAVIDYRLRLRGIPICWQSEITTWEPPYCFVDEQRKGPYQLWVHKHRFSEQDGMTLAEDVVHYAVHGGSLVNRWLIEPDLQRIFGYRREQMRKIFGETSREISQVTQPVG